MITGYRDHTQPLLLRCDPREVMAELYGRRDGLSKGKGGSMHLFAIDRGLLGRLEDGREATSRWAWGWLPPCGLRGTDPHFPSSALGEGRCKSAPSIGGRPGLGCGAGKAGSPVLFIVENNRYGMGTSVERSTAMTDLAAKFDPYGIVHEKVDGMDLEAVLACAARVHPAGARERQALRGRGGDLPARLPRRRRLL